MAEAKKTTESPKTTDADQVGVTADPEIHFVPPQTGVDQPVAVEASSLDEAIKLAKKQSDKEQ